MRVLVDANVLVDHLAGREPFCDAAELLIDLGMVGEFDLWMSVSQVADLFYLLSGGGRKELISIAKQQIRALRKAVRVCSLSELDVDAALDSNWGDFEDACVYQAACKIKADFIVTRNQRDFEKSSIRAVSAEELFDCLEKERGLAYAALVS